MAARSGGGSGGTKGLAVSEGIEVGRLRIVFRGVVQGVGFRPALYRSAVECGLSGFVQNRRSEVAAELEGPRQALERFHSVFEARLPAPARIDFRSVDELEPTGERGFRIVESADSIYILPPIPPDLALCDSCRRELLDPGNRRYLYPFITCTECGPRYSIVEDTPFDRERGSMADFAQCGLCRTEYANPSDRRFHSQTNSCPDCGPALHLAASGGEELPGDPLVEAVRALARGEVLALQGLGGFHLAADPRFPGAVERLRREKERGTKPFALMVRDEDEARRLCSLSSEALALLKSAASPIVVLPARETRPEHLAAVSDLDTLGIMLPYTPLHYLLFFHPEAEIGYRHLVMTSGNLGNEPIIAESEEARMKLAGTADLFLYHDRRILQRVDDSVLRWAGTGRGETDEKAGPPEGKSLPAGGSDGRGAARTDLRTSETSPAEPPYFLMRRSRGFVPRPILLARPIAEPTLAAGGDLKSAPALAEADRLVLAPHLGDLDEPSTREAYLRAVEGMISLNASSPTRVVYDLHPRYFSSSWAAGSPIPRKVAVQHHHAHILSVMAEHGLDEALGVAFDGTGYGLDGTIWGGEFLHARRGGFERLGAFRPFALPGGEAAILHPARIAFSILRGFDARAEESLARGMPEREAALLSRMIDGGLNSPECSSAGRLFDAAAALICGLGEVGYEGEGPMKLEALATRGAGADRPRATGKGGGRSWNPADEELLPCAPATGSAAAGAQARGAARPDPAAPHAPARPATAATAPGAAGMFLFDPRPLLSHIALRVDRDESAALALLFHEVMARAILRGASLMRERTGLGRLCLSGGVFQNALLRRLAAPPLRREGFELYWNLEVPPGDGSLALGQAWFEG